MGESQLQGEDNPSSLVSQIMACPEAIEGLSKALMNSISQLRLPNSGGTSPVGRLEGLRQRFREKNISNQAMTTSRPCGEIKPTLTTTLCGGLGSLGAQQEVSIPLQQIYSSVLDFSAGKYTAGLKYHSLNQPSLLFCCQ